MRWYAPHRIWTTRSAAWLFTAAVCTGIAAAGCGRSDAAVQADLQKQLAADPGTAGAHLAVTVTNGVARLKGETDTVAQQQRALDVARAVKGVTSVESDMRLNDATLTDLVKKAIAADASVSSIPLTVEVKDAEVKLFSDKTNEDERNKLRQIAGGVPGVVHVEDDMK